MTFGLGAGLLFIGLVTLLASVRFVRSGSERRCRECDYDLTGMTPDTRRCPECGNRLGPRDVIQSSGADALRQARPVFRVLGSIAALVGAGFLLTALEASPRRLPWTPTWYLVRFDLPGAVRRQDPKVMAELLDRMHANTLDSETHRAAARTIIKGSQSMQPGTVMSGFGSYGHEILHPLIEEGQLTSVDLAESLAIPGQLSINPADAVDVGAYRWGLQLASNYTFSAPFPPNLLRYDVRITEILIDGLPTEHPPFTLTRNRQLFSENMVSFHGTWGNDPTINPIEPGLHELTVRGEYAWSDHTGTSWREGARQPFEVNAPVSIRSEPAPRPPFMSDAKAIADIRDELEAHSFIDPDGTLTLGISQPITASLLHDGRIKLGLDLVDLMSPTRMLAARFSDPAIHHSRKDDRGGVIFDLQRMVVPRAQRDRIPEVGSTVTIWMEPAFDLQSWYSMGGDGETPFLDAGFEIEVPVKPAS